MTNPAYLELWLRSGCEGEPEDWMTDDEREAWLHEGEDAEEDK